MKIVAILDCAAGNGEVGTMWKETAIFDDKQPISELLIWAVKQGFRTQSAGALTVTIPELEKPTP